MTIGCRTVAFIQRFGMNEHLVKRSRGWFGHGTIRMAPRYMQDVRVSGTSALPGLVPIKRERGLGLDPSCDQVGLFAYRLAIHLLKLLRSLRELIYTLYLWRAHNKVAHSYKIDTS